MATSTQYTDKLLEFLHQPNLFVISETKTSMVNKFEIAPNDFLDFAEKDLDSNLPHRYVNCLANLKRALDCQIANIFSALGMSDKKMGLEKKMEIIQKLGLVTPRILNKVGKVRNLMEHEFANPDEETVIDMLDVVSLFIAYTDTIMNNYPDEVVVALRNENYEPEGEEIGLKIDSEKKRLTVWSSISDEKLILSPDHQDFFAFMERLIFIRWGIGSNPME